MPALAGLCEDIRLNRPHLFSDTAVFISPRQMQGMAAVVEAMEGVVAAPGYGEAVLGRSPAIARRDFGPRGVFLGYDFHLSPDGPRLIEINTNAGGALLNLALLRAWRGDGAEAAQAEQAFFAMFLAEWRAQRGDAPLGRMAVVDERPQEQYLYPEFRLFEAMFTRLGAAAVIAGPEALEWRDGRLWHEGQVVDMVYNRLTDFYLEDDAHAALRQAYEAGAVVLTPHPRAHALYADKRNLMLLGDDAALAGWGVPAAAREALTAHVPRTLLVDAANADALWAERRRWFFKPAAGYGSKAAYRGDKITKRVWEDICAGGYVAQETVPPGEWDVTVDGAETRLKFDVRAYAYAGRVQLLAARLYQGQTTNFRTPGGGFAPVFVAEEGTVK